MLDDIAANGMIAVVFSQPSTHRTIQLKGTDARRGRGHAPATAPSPRATSQHWVDGPRLRSATRPEFARAVHGARRTRWSRSVHADRGVPADARPRGRRSGCAR